MIQRSPRRNRPSRRRGYALVLVCLFVVLFLSLLGVAWRQMASALRIASLQSIQQQSGNTSVFQTQRDAGSVPALALAMRMLELRLCTNPTTGVTQLNVAGDVTQAPTSSNLESSYACTVIIDSTTGSRVSNPGPTTKYYTVTFDYDTGYSDGSHWSVAVAPSTSSDISNLPAMPSNPP